MPSRGRPSGSLCGLDLDAIRVVGAHFMQSDDVRHHQAQQHQWHGNHVKAEEPIQCGVAHHKVTANQQRQIRPDKGNGGKQVDNHLRAPIAHLPPRQQIAHERFSHQRQENPAAKKPDQLTWLAITAVHQAPEHVQVHHNKEGRGTGGVHVANQPSPGHVAHDVLDRTKSQCRVGLVVHDQKDAGHDLNAPAPAVKASQRCTKN